MDTEQINEQRLNEVALQIIARMEQRHIELKDDEISFLTWKHRNDNKPLEV